MALYSNAAMIMFYDVAPGAVDDHDDWHTHEHIPERVSIPGFLRGSRWTAEEGGPRYMMMYEVAGVEVLTGAAYLERLNNPTPWTSRIMTQVRGSMVRGFCRLRASSGFGRGGFIVSTRHSAAAGREDKLREWLAQALPGISSKPGIASCHLFEPAARPAMTREQSIRGKDADASSVLLVSGYDRDRIGAVADGELALERFQQHGAAESVRATYRLAFSLSKREVADDSR
jgi:hypothetical protein